MSNFPRIKETFDKSKVSHQVTAWLGSQIFAFTIGVIITILFLTHPSYKDIALWLFNRLSDLAVQVLSHEITRRIT
jgi:hypothetical protein